MNTYEYPKEITFGSALDQCKNPDDLNSGLRNIITNTKMTLLAENILQIDYPEDLIEQVRTVNVDDTIFRIDLIKKEPFGYGRVCLFPHIHWNRENFFKNKRFNNGRRTEAPGRVTFKYPTLES